VVVEVAVAADIIGGTGDAVRSLSSLVDDISAPPFESASARAAAAAVVGGKPCSDVVVAAAVVAGNATD
jgi:hypothetical protein